MKNVIKNLERYYQYFIDQPDNRDFYLGLADYVKYIDETPEILKIIEPIEKERNKAKKELNKYEIEAIKEIKEIYRKLFKEIKEGKVACKDIENSATRF